MPRLAMPRLCKAELILAVPCLRHAVLIHAEPSLLQTIPCFSFASHTVTNRHLAIPLPFRAILFLRCALRISSDLCRSLACHLRTTLYYSVAFHIYTVLFLHPSCRCISAPCFSFASRILSAPPVALPLQHSAYPFHAKPSHVESAPFVTMLFLRRSFPITALRCTSFASRIAPYLCLSIA